jgi:hypothetical protein
MFLSKQVESVAVTGHLASGVFPVRESGMPSLCSPWNPQGQNKDENQDKVYAPVVDTHG